MSSYPPVAGHCPACGAESLFLAESGHITCARLDCPRPTATDELLAERETEHIVAIGETSFTLRHPLIERLDDTLMGCDLHMRITAANQPPWQPGRYRILRASDGRWAWELLHEPEVAHA